MERIRRDNLYVVLVLAERIHKRRFEGVYNIPYKHKLAITSQLMADIDALIVL